MLYLRGDWRKGTTRMHVLLNNEAANFLHNKVKQMGDSVPTHGVSFFQAGNTCLITFSSNKFTEKQIELDHQKTGVH